MTRPTKVAPSILKSTVEGIVKNDRHNEHLLFSDFQVEVAKGTWTSFDQCYLQIISLLASQRLMKSEQLRQYSETLKV